MGLLGSGSGAETVSGERQEDVLLEALERDFRH